MRKKVLIIFIILMMVLNIIVPVVNAAQIITMANLYCDHEIDTHILYYNESMEEWRDIQCGYICYTFAAKKYPAYCVSHGLNGVDEEGTYEVTVNDLLKDELIYNTIINGYPYKTPTELGLQNADDAYVATKHAVFSVLLDRDIKSYYKAADARGENIIEAIYNIAKAGKIGTSSNKDAVLSVDKLGKMTEKGEYYYQEYSVMADTTISKYVVKSIKDFPDGTYIADETGKEEKTFQSGEKFRVMIPKNELNKNIEGEIDVVATCETKAIFYGEAPKENLQNYAVTYKPYAEYKTTKEFSEDTDTSSIKIIKKDEETSKAIKDVEFGLYNAKDEYITSKKTNEEGIAIFSDLYQGEYKVKELTANANYVKDDSTYLINTEYNKESSKTITNMHKKGNLKIVKVDKDDNNEVLKGIEFDLINSSNQVVAHLITDSNGEAKTNNINIGKYTIRETKTKENYNLCIDNDIKVNWNETTEIKIENEKKKGQIKITKQDKENNEIKLEGVEFQILDYNNRIVDKVITDKNGEVISSRLPIGDYIIKEVNLGENDDYILNEELCRITVEDNKISYITIENIHKKGNLKITKVDKDDNNITLGAIEFDLIDENGKIVSHLITDVNGEVFVENINTGKYTIKETKTKREYDLCENKDIIVKWNRTEEIVIENEKKKGQIKIIKQDEEIKELKLEGVKFQIVDRNNKVVEEIETNSKGEAISSRLLIGEYQIKEIDLGNNTNYLLSDEIYNIKIEDKSITELIVKNEHKKGSLTIKKIDKDNNNILLEGVEFKVIDKDGYTYKTITDENGLAKIDNIRIGNVEIKETKTKDNYVLSDEIFKTEIKYDKNIEIVIENEKKKGQVEIYKTDKENKEIKISNVEFEILDSDNIVVDRIKTNENGYGMSKKISVGKYYLKEVKTNNKYILNDNIMEINIEDNKILRFDIENEKIKGKIKIIKTSSNESPILDIKAGETLENVEFEILNSNNEIVDILITNEKGQAISKELEVGRYKVREKSTNKYYILNTDEFFVNIESNNEIKILEIQNEAVIPSLCIEKVGQQFAERNEEIKYEFNIRNTSNTKLDDFTWKELIPYEDVKIEKMVTGVYSENIDYNLYYKTNKNDYKLFKKINSCTSEYINFDILSLEKEEIVTEIKVEYGTVSKDFASIIKPVVFTKVRDNVKKGDKIINATELSGRVEEYSVSDTSQFETVVQEKEIFKKLPKTGC